MPIAVRDDISISSFEDLDCPLCAEHFEFDEINFFPCNCGYQICKFCFDRILNDSDPMKRICPACRQEYSDKPILHQPISSKLKEKLEKGIQERNSKKDINNNITVAAKVQDPPEILAEQRKHLHGIRVLQKNLVFISSGLTAGTLAEEKSIQMKIRRSFEIFGNIKKVIITQPNSQLPEYIQAYITFEKTESALKAIIRRNESPWEGRLLRCSLGTTKYCSRFLRGLDCGNTECMYLHELAPAQAIRKTVPCYFLKIRVKV